MRALHWSTRLELFLAEPGALRVLNTASIVQVAKKVRLGLSKPSVERWIQEAVAANRLQRVVRGLFLNRLVAPAAQLSEAAVWLRPGAVVSLQTVLGDAGVSTIGGRHRRRHCCTGSIYPTRHEAACPLRPWISILPRWT